MRSIKKITALLLVALMMMSFAGCVLNEEKDAKAVVATINGVDYSKGDFNEFYSFYLFLQEVNGNAITGTDEEMKEVKATKFLDYVFNILTKVECEAAGITENTAVVEQSVSSLIEQARTSFEGSAYTELLAKYGYTEENIEAVATEMLKFFDYSNLFLSNNIDNTFDSHIATTVEGTEIPMSTFYYYALVNYLITVINGGNVDFYDTDSYYTTAYTYVTTGAKAIKYVEENNIDIPEETITANEDTIVMLDLYGLNDYAKNVCLLTNDQIDAGMEFVVNALSAQKVILDAFGDSFEYTDEELLAYYNSGIDKYDTSTVKAYHILTEDADFAQDMFDETGGTADGFMDVYEKYGSDERVTQAIDLGEFGRGEMVSEFEDCAFGLDAGEVAMCETSFGTHLVYVYETNITETTFESAKEAVLEDYKADQIAYFGQSHLSEVIAEYEDEEGDFRIIPIDLITEYLYEKYDVQIDTKAARR